MQVVDFKSLTMISLDLIFMQYYTFILLCFILNNFAHVLLQVSYVMESWIWMR